jgi:hypothetical protein
MLGLRWRESRSTDRGAGPRERRAMLFFQGRSAAELQREREGQNLLDLHERKSRSDERGSSAGRGRAVLFVQRRGAAELPRRKTDATARQADAPTATYTSSDKAHTEIRAGSISECGMRNDDGGSSASPLDAKNSVGGAETCLPFVGQPLPVAVFKRAAGEELSGRASIINASHQPLRRWVLARGGRVQEASVRRDRGTRGRA